jgi:DNA polymerase III subunit gamma/tau
VQQVPRGSTLLPMQYQVLARKWRPQNFHELVGQEHVSRTLLNALQMGRVAHAFLFSGPRGSGKTTTARILAKALNCVEGRPGEPCGKCVACTEIAAGNCMDVLEIDAASNTGVDNVRQLIEQARYNPARDRNKVFIIDEVHMLSNSAFAALLKTLEEPPERVVFILATTEYHKIPATILSRCQQYNFKLIQYPLIMKRLRQIADDESIQISNAALEQVVFSSGGSMRDAMSALDQVIAFSGNAVRDEDATMLLGLIEPKILSQTVRAIAKGDLATILKQVADLVEAGQDLNNFCRRLSGQFRNLMVLKTGIEDPQLLGIPASILPDSREQADLFSREDLLRLFDGFTKIETGMKYATQVRFQLEMGLIELSQIAKLRSLEDLIAEFTALSKGELPQKSNPVAERPIASPPVPVQTPRPASLRPQPKNATKPTPETVEEPRIPAESSGPRTGEVLASSQVARDVLLRIAAATGREALESLLHRLEGARLEADRVVLLPGTANEFFRKQIRDNLPAIEEAAVKIAGGRVKVLLEDTASSGRLVPPEGQVEAQDIQPEPNILDRAKREPIVKSFLDVFPGRVKAEKIDS